LVFAAENQALEIRPCHPEASQKEDVEGNEGAQCLPQYSVEAQDIALYVLYCPVQECQQWEQAGQFDGVVCLWSWFTGHIYAGFTLCRPQGFRLADCAAIRLPDKRSAAVLHFAWYRQFSCGG
jgi:hypothetical protein